MNFLPIALLPADQDRAAQLPAGTHTIGLRPEHALVADDGPIQLKVVQVEQLGSSSLLLGKVGADTPFEMVCPGQTTLKGGDTVRLGLPSQHLHCFNQDGQRL